MCVISAFFFLSSFTTIVLIKKCSVTFKQDLKQGFQATLFRFIKFSILKMLRMFEETKFAKRYGFTLRENW